MNLLAFILTAYGMTFIIVYGKIFEDIRPKKIIQRSGTLYGTALFAWASGLALFYVAFHLIPNYLVLSVLLGMHLFLAVFQLEHLI